MKLRAAVTLLLLLTAANVPGDVAPPVGGNDYHYVTRNIAITGLSSFTDTVLVMLDYTGVHLVTEDSLLGSDVQLFAVPQAHLDGIGGVQNLSADRIQASAIDSVASIFLPSLRLSDDYSLSAETLTYELTRADGGSVVRTPWLSLGSAQRRARVKSWVASSPTAMDGSGRQWSPWRSPGRFLPSAATVWDGPLAACWSSR